MKDECGVGTCGRICQNSVFEDKNERSKRVIAETGSCVLNGLQAINAQPLEKVKRAFCRVGECEKPTFCMLVAPVSMDQGMVGRRCQNCCENQRAKTMQMGRVFAPKV